MKRYVFIVGLLLLLASCSDEIPVHEFEENVNFIYTEEDFPKGAYCFHSQVGYDYCATSYELYNELRLEFDGAIYTLDEISQHLQSPDYITGIPGIFVYIRENNAVATSEHQAPWLISSTRPPENWDMKTTVYLLDYGESYHEVDGKMAIQKSEDEFCMVDAGHLSRYGIYYAGRIFNIRNLFEYFTYEEVKDSGLNLDCTSKTKTIDGITYNRRYIDSDIEVLYRVYNDSDLPESSLIEMEFTDNQETYCYTRNNGLIYDYILYEGDIYDVQEALDLEIIEGVDLFRYNMSQCGTSTPWNRYAFIEKEYNCVDPDEVVFEQKAHHSINEMTLYTTYDNIVCIEEYYEYITIIVDNETYLIQNGEYNHTYRILYNEEYITLSEAVEEGIITLQDLVDDSRIKTYWYGTTN